MPKMEKDVSFIIWIIQSLFGKTCTNIVVIMVIINFGLI